MILVFFPLGHRKFKLNYACLQRLGGHPVNLFFDDSTFVHLGDITFQWNYAFLIVLEDVHIPLSMTTFFQNLLSINEDSYPHWVVTIKSVYFISFSSSALDLSCQEPSVNKKRSCTEFFYLAMYGPLKFWLLEIFMSPFSSIFLRTFNSPMIVFCLLWVYDTYQWISLFLQGLILPNEGKIRYPLYFVFNFHTLDVFSFQIYLFFFNVFFIPIVKIVHNEKTDSIWEWHILATFVYLHNCCYYKKK